MLFLSYSLGMRNNPEPAIEDSHVLRRLEAFACEQRVTGDTWGTTEKLQGDYGDVLNVLPGFKTMRMRRICDSDDGKFGLCIVKTEEGFFWARE